MSCLLSAWVGGCGGAASEPETSGDPDLNGSSGETSGASATEGPTSGPGTEGSTSEGATETQGETSADETGGDTTDPPVCDASGFEADAFAWTLPELGFPFEDYGEQPLEQLSRSWSCTNSESYHHQVIDITGDGILDLLVTDACDEGGVGLEQWLVYPGESAGFGDAMPWTLPELSFPFEDYGERPLEQLSRSWSCTNGESYRHQVIDMTGDGILDLLVTDACDGGGVGLEQWLVYPGEGAGFGDAMPWALPELAFPLEDYGEHPLEELARVWSCTNGESYRQQVFDVTGDGIVDLLLSDACDAGGVGEEQWLVYPGGASGFGEAMPWTLPELNFPFEEYGEQPLEQLSRVWSCTNGESYRQQVFDVTGDGTPDLLVSDACDAGGVGQEQWLVYPGGASGFGEASSWELPELSFPFEEYGEQPLERLSRAWSCTNGESYRQQVFDVTGDGIIDVLVTDACDVDGVGDERWLVYPGRASGFSEPFGWALPTLSFPFEDYGERPLEELSRSWSCTNSESYQQQVFDVTGDGALDLLVTDACDEAGVGQEQWLVFDAMCG